MTNSPQLRQMIGKIRQETSGNVMTFADMSENVTPEQNRIEQNRIEQNRKIIVHLAMDEIVMMILKPTSALTKKASKSSGPCTHGKKRRKDQQ